jgi:ketosteroid isomerase-like protein
MGEHGVYLREKYDRFIGGDVQSATEDWGDDFVWDGGNNGLAGSGEHQGKDAALKVLGEAVGQWDRFELAIDEMIEEGDTVVALGHSNVAKDDRSAKIPVVHIWRFDGDKPVRLQILTDSFMGAQVLGKA